MGENQSRTSEDINKKHIKSPTKSKESLLEILDIFLFKKNLSINWQLEFYFS